MYRATVIPITTDGSGDATAYSEPCIGVLHGFVYVPGSVVTGADFTITDEATGAALLTLTNGGTSVVTILTRAPTAGQTNTASLYAAAGTAIEDKLPLFGRIKVVCANGGATKVGALYALWDDGC